MAYTYYRIYGSPFRKKKKRIGRGRKKKARRIHWADARDGGRRKRAGRLSPAFRPSKVELRTELRRGGQWHGQVKIAPDFNELPDDFMNTYKADISVRRVGVHTAPRIPWYDPRIQFSSCLNREVFEAADITEARQSAIALVENPNLPEFQKVLDDYFVPHKTLEWNDWTDPIEYENETGYKDTTQIHSCSSYPFLVGNFKWIVIILVSEV